MFTDGQLEGQTDAGEFQDRKKLRPEELIISKKGPQKGRQI